MTDINISEAVSEFRKFNRAFKAMEHAETVLEALSKIDVLEREATERLKVATVDKEKAEKKLADLESLIAQATVSANDLKYKNEQSKKDAEADANRLVLDAKIKADRIIADADAMSNRAQNEVASLKGTKISILREIESTNNELNTLRANMAKERKRIVDSFG